ncbi:E3 ubiquitin-protein ligase rnf213-alpha-like isoform X2 [Clavelina lepadiformis]|uniref:E3 ubiquitin-protein ligase rnf213-alpha-like isoform X2 n=1 Tax=Clavelina lepadiformis TaxID=159417 RepID=UPI004040FC66
MSNKQKLLQLISLLQEALSEQDVKSLAKELQQKRCFKNIFKNINKSQKSATKVLVNALQKTDVKHWTKYFLEAIKNLGKPVLRDVIEKFFCSEKQSLSWIISNFEHLKSARNVFCGIEFIIENFPGAEESSFEKRLALLQYVAISDEDSKTVELIVTQLQKNLHSSSVGKVDTLQSKSKKQRPLEGLKDMFISTLTIDQCINIAKILESHKHITNRELKQIEKHTKKKHHSLETYTKFLEVTSKNASAECFDCFVAAISTVSDRNKLLARAVETFLKGSCPALTWLVLYWKKLHQHCATITNAACEGITSTKELSKSGEMWLCHIMYRVTKADHKSVSVFMQEVHKLLDETLSQYDCDSIEDIDSDMDSEKNPISGQDGDNLVPLSKLGELGSADSHNQNTTIPIPFDDQGSINGNSTNEKESKIKEDIKATATVDNITGEPVATDSCDVVNTVQTGSSSEKSLNSDRSFSELAVSNTPDVIITIHDESTPEKTLPCTSSPSSDFASNVNEKIAVIEQKQDDFSKQKQHSDNDVTINSGTSRNNHTGDKTRQKNVSERNSTDKAEQSNKDDGVTHQSESVPYENGKTQNLSKGTANSSIMSEMSYRDAVATSQTSLNQHTYELRSQNTSRPSQQQPDLQSKDDTTCKKMPSITVEFSLLIDKNCTLPENGMCCVYVDNTNEYLLMKCSHYHERIWHVWTTLPKVDVIVYKYYFAHEYEKESRFEVLPGDKTDPVNRVTAVSAERVMANCMTLLDVASYDLKDCLSDFHSMYARNVKEHLPSPSSLKFGMYQTGHMHFSDFVRLLNAWWLSALSGVRFKPAIRPVGLYETASWKTARLLPTFKTELERYIVSTNEKLSNAQGPALGQKVMAFVAVAMIIQKYQLSYDRKVWNALCQGLSLLRFDKIHVKMLFEQLSSNKEILKDVLSALDYILECNKWHIRILWLVPFYYILCNNGDCKTHLGLWNETLTKFGTHHLHDNLKYHEGLSCIIPEFLSETFPNMVKVIVEILPWQSVLHYINKSNSLPSLQLGQLFVRIATEVSENDLPKVFGSKKFMEWIEYYIDNLFADTDKRGAQVELKNWIDNLGKHSIHLLKKWTIFSQKNYKNLRNSLSVALKIYLCSVNLNKTTPEIEQDSHEIISSILTIVVKWLESDYSTDIDYDHVQFWNYLLTANVLDYAEMWQTHLSIAIQDIILQKLRKDNTLIESFGGKLVKYKASKEVESCFSEAIYQFASQVSKDKSGSFFGLLATDFQKKLVPIFQRLFNKEWSGLSQGDNVEAVLNFMLHWPFAVQFFKLFDEKEKVHMLSKETQREFCHIKHRMSLIMTDVSNGMIRFDHMCQILEDKITFMEASSVINNDKTSGSCIDSQRDAAILLEARARELAAISQLKDQAAYFIDLCNDSEIISFNLEEVFAVCDPSVSNMHWCKVFASHVESGSEQRSIQVVAFQLSNDVKAALKEMFNYKINETKLARDIFFHHVNVYVQARENDTENRQMEMLALVPIWQSTKLKLSLLKDELVTGAINLDNVNDIFGSYNVEDPSSLIKMVTKLVQAIYAFPDVDVNAKEIILEEKQTETCETKEAASISLNSVYEPEEQQINFDEPSVIVDCVQEIPCSQNEVICDDDEASTTGISLASADLDFVDEPTSSHYDSTENLEDDNVSISSTCTDVLEEEMEFKNELERINFRVRQICNYFLLKRHQNTTSVFRNLKQCLKLKGDFSYVDVAQEKNKLPQSKPLKSISCHMMDVGEALKDISEKQLELLMEFMKNEDLIEWLRKNMKDRGEVKVMSDLAMISAGETTLEVDRVSCFLSAVMGFAPFIFDLEEKADLSDAVIALNKVWLTSLNDSRLLDKWHGTAQYLEWLKGIKDFHGSVEKSSLSRAQDINAHGVYIIGGETDLIPTTENVLKLELSANQEADDTKVMTVKDLRNLQSRLMLIAGEAEKGLDEVKLFIEVLSHVESLTKAYVKLKTSGCLLFNSWTAKLRYQVVSKEIESDDSSIIKISFDEKSQPMLCQEDVLDELKKLAIVLEDAHAKWVNNLIKKRQQFYHLNHFSIQQITYLCKELAGVDEFGVIPDQVFTLLACIKQDVSDKDIIQLLQEATKAKNDEDCTDENEVKTLHETVPLSPIEQKKQMARRLVELEEDMSERLAKASVQAVGLPLDYDDCYFKSLEITFDDDQINELAKAFDKEIGFDSNSSQINVIESVVNDRSSLTLQNVIEKILSGPESGKNCLSVALKTICERYVEATSVTSLSDCISIEHFGHFVTNLSMQVDKKYIIVRHLPETLEPCKPNLIICQEQEVFSTLLSLYMNSPEQQLPTTSEVLLCSKTTTKEEAELLLRRAMQTGTKTDTKIYCLAFADNLTFDVANATENMMRQLEKEPNLNPNYKLVIICSAPQQYIASLLYENRVEYNAHISQEMTQTYLNNHLSIDQTEIAEYGTRFHNAVKTSVQVVSSERAGLGKSLHISRCRSYLPQSFHKRTIRLLEKQLDENDVMQCLLPEKEDISNGAPHFIHFDVTPSVQQGVNTFMFNLLILGAFKNNLGTLWRRHPNHFYFIEFTNSESIKGVSLEQQLLGLLPAIHCISPKTIVSQNFNGNIENYLLMDEVEFQSETYQRPYQFLHRYSRNESLDKFSYISPTGTPEDCIETLLSYSSISDPTWSELRHFASFLNCQLLDCEQSLFCNQAIVGADSGLSGFKNFVVRFMIRMSQDFATPSLSLPDAGKNDVENSVFELHQLRRHWEEDVHPYLFFNEDHMSMTFVNFQLNQNGDLLHPKTKRVMENSLMRKQLMRGLKLQRVNLNEDFDALSRQHKLSTLCRVMGIKEDIDDPDPTYELTTDNVLKMLAIHMRFRCGIPVVVMGETGCGKTRMIEFMSKLKAGNNLQVQNMLIVKVHGGITVPIIQEKVRKAVVLARNNKTTHAVETMLFLDEANTTEAIYAIKEFVCDQTVHGEAFNDTGLNIVAACNPYRRHSEDALKSMEESGLGFRVKTDKTADKLGSIPMRCLVYRVIALPPSMQPLVWDFGQLTNDAEKVYIEQMVSKLKEPAAARSVFHSPPAIQLTVNVLATSQKYMREQRQQCSFVSLRDVERCLTSFLWFYHNQSWLFPMIQQENNKTALDPVVRTLLQAVGMCYHVTLEERDNYREKISHCLRSEGINLSSQAILDEITACQAVFIMELTLEDNIARNEALRENVFMMVMCTEMRIPLFLIGKPGSSKSLAKTIVTDAMQGPSSKSSIFQRLKQIHVLSFQCSAVSDAVGIEAVFGQCAQVQKNQDPEKFVSVVVLDEVGLAEDSPKMPLKVLHPLLEGGGATSEEPFVMNRDDQKRVGFVGISNWALDPAKMNRGIFVHRGAPTENDLKLTAKGIFSSETTQFKEIGEIVDVLTASYLEICENQEQEFFGLRDYYGLLKMIFAVANKSETDLEYYHVASAIKRNFSGGKIDCVHIFLKHLQRIWPDAKVPKFSLESMIRSNLDSVNDCESRFLLLLSNQFTAMGLLNKIVDCSKFQVIFGSSFPQDNDYTELCRNINKIKMCMESGCTVVLLNLRDLYESLYDALNQHYVTFAGQRYVDLGLGGHRVKCRVAKEFRLIVIEDKDVVYDQFPIPLINRLEKYIFTTDSILSGDQEGIAGRLDDWVNSFAEMLTPLHLRQSMKQFVAKDSFVGYTRDSAAAALLSVIDSCKKKDQHSEAQKIQVNIYDEAKRKLLNTATLDSVFRLSTSKVYKEAAKLTEKYLHDQSHDNLFSFFHRILDQDTVFDYPLMYEIISFSQIMSEQDRQKLESELGMFESSVKLVTLQQFQTQEEYSQKVRLFLKFATEQNSENRNAILLIQCPQAQRNGKLISCARYTVKNLIQASWPSKDKTSCGIVIAFLYTMERTCGTSPNNSLYSFCSSDCQSVYIDELRMSADYIGHVSKFWNKTMSEVLKESKASLQPSTSSCKLRDPDYLIDPKALICNSIPSAMIKLTNKIQSDGTGDLGKRNRVKIMHHLCTGNTMITVPFLKIFFERIVKAIQNHEVALGCGTSWQHTEACSHEALQEGGTFGKTLWLRLKKMVTVAMAKIVSIIDEDDNLDLICDEQVDPHLADFWLRMFNSDDACNFKFNETFHTASEFEIYNKLGFKCKFPFSRQITELFTKHWLCMHNAENHATFYTKVENFSINNVVADLLENKPMHFLHCYAHDLVNLKYKSDHDDMAEMNLITEALLAIFKSKQKLNLLGGNNMIASIYASFMASSCQLNQFSIFVGMFPDILNEKNMENWLAEQRKCDDFVLHLFAFDAILQSLEANIQKLSEKDYYSKWRDLVKIVINTDIAFVQSSAITDHVQAICIKMESKRKSMAFIELFLKTLVPDGLESELFNKYLQTLAPSARRLSKGAKISGLGDAKFLKIVIDTLRGCKNFIYHKHLLSWNDLKCKLCSKAKAVKPVVLPCKHFFCLNCIKLTANANIRECPICHQCFPEDFPISPTQLSAEQIVHMNAFKANCTSFFLEYLSNLCFPAPGSSSDNDVSKDVTEVLQNLVICEEATRTMTPLEVETEMFDKTPTVRSFILQLLLRYNPEKTQSILETHFQKQDQILSNRQELMMIYIRCIEDSLQNRFSGLEAPLQGFNHRTDVNSYLIADIEEFLNSDKCFAQVDVLNAIAKMRFLIKQATEHFYRCHYSVDESEIDTKQNASLLDLCHLCENHDLSVARQYFVKILCRRYGLNTFSQLNQSEEFRDLIPGDLKLEYFEQDTSPSTLLYAIGPEYASTQNLLLSVDKIESFKLIIESLCEKAKSSTDTAVSVMHSVLTWTRSSQNLEIAIIRNTFFTNLLEDFENVPNIPSSLVNHYKALALNKFLPSQIGNIGDNMFHALIELVELIGSCIHFSSSSLLVDFAELITNPQTIQNSFLPTMPQSSYFEVKDVVAALVEQYGKPPKSYLCPNGHVYFIGDCTNPNDEGICPECKKAIGGVKGSTTLQPDNVAGEVTEISQAGYLLGSAKDRSSSAVPERSSSRLSVCVMRMFLHSALVYAAANDNYLTRILELKSSEETQEFLFCHLQKDLNQFCDCLGKSIEDAILFLHQVAKVVRNTQIRKPPQAHFKSMEARKNWEIEFHRQYLASVFIQSDEKIDEARKLCLSSRRQNNLECMVYEMSEDGKVDSLLDEDDQVSFHSPSLWRFQAHVTVEHLRQRLEGMVSGEKDDGSVLKAILNETDLSAVQHLPAIISIQAALIQRFKHKVDMADMDVMTLQDYCYDNNIGEDFQFQFYFGIWGLLKRNFAKSNAHGIPQQYFEEELSFKSPISMLVPSKAGRGRCALALTEYVVEKQNHLLLKCRNLITPTPSFKEVSIPDMRINDLICIDDDRSLLPLILANAEYEVTRGETGIKHRIAYRVPALEKQILDKFILNKKLLKKETLPCMEYLQDTGIEKECEEMQNNVEQSFVILKIVQKLDDMMQKARLPDICEGVRTLTLVISYLAKAGSNPDQLLTNYVTEDLLLPSDEAAMIPRTAQLRHTLALFESLSWQRSVRFVATGQDPFANIVNQVETPNVEVVKKSLDRINIPQLQFELNSLILIKQSLSPESSLRDNLQAYVAMKYDDDVDSDWCQNLPENLKIKHGAHLFKISVEMSE